MPCQPAARTPKPLSQCLEQDSRAVKPLHTLRHTTQKMQSRLKSLLRGKRPHVCFLGLSCKPLRGDPQIIRWDCRRCCVRLVTWGKIQENKQKDLSSMLNSSNRANLQLLYHTAELFPIFALQREHSASIMAESKTPGPWTSACGVGILQRFNLSEPTPDEEQYLLCCFPSQNVIRRTLLCHIVK